MEAQQAANEVNTTKMEEPDEVMTKENPKKVKQGKRLAEYNHRKREELKDQKSKSKSKLTPRQYYGVGAVMAVGSVRHSWLLHLLIQEGRHHQGDSD